MKRKVRILRRSFPLWLLILLLIASGIGAAVGTILAGRVTGEVPVTVSQALLTGSPIFPSSMPSGVTRQTIRIQPNAPDRAIGIVGDDRTSFRAGVEVDVGDVFLIQLPLKNASNQDLTAELTLTVPDCIEVEVFGSDEETESEYDHTSNVTRIGPNKWNFFVSYLAEMSTFDWRDSIGIVIGVDDDCMPGFYTIEATLEQIVGTYIERPYLSISKAGPVEADLNEQVDYTIVVTNISQTTANLVVVKDIIPAGMTYISSTPTADAVSGKLVTWNLGTLDAGNSTTLLLRLRAIQTGVWTDKAQVISAEKVIAEASATTIVVALIPAVDIQKTGPAELTQGTNGTYTITVRNTGEATLTNVTVTDQIPVGMSYVSSSPVGTQADNQVSWGLGSLSSGQQRTISLTLKGETVGTWTNSASVTCDEGVTDTDSATTEIVPAAGGMTFYSYDTDDPVVVGDNTTYVVKVINQGQIILHDVQIANTIPDEMSFVSISGPSSYSFDGQTVTFSPVATIAPGETLTYNITVQADTPGAVINSTTLTYAEFGFPLTTQEPTTIEVAP